MKNHTRISTMLLAATVLLIAVFMTGCTELLAPSDITPLGGRYANQI